MGNYFNWLCRWGNYGDDLRPHHELSPEMIAIPKKATKPKSKSLKWYRDKAWELTSKYVRLREADEDGYNRCVTCGITKHWKELQAGHFVAQAQGNAARWDLRNIHPQCYRCNINLGGNGAEYGPYIRAQFGDEAHDEIRRLAGQTRIMRRADYEEIIDDMATRLARIALNPGEREESESTRWALEHCS